MRHQLEGGEHPCEPSIVRRPTGLLESNLIKYPAMKLLRSFVFLCLATLALTVTRATTVIPPTFDDLVTKAETIFEGTVTGLRSEWTGEGANRHIVTYVSFKVEDAIKGATSADYTIRMFGGTVDGHTIEVTDAPKFKVGDRDILFVEHNGTQFIPLVGIMHGRFHVVADDNGANEKVTKDSGAPVADPGKLGQDEVAAVTGKAMTKAEFKAAIRQKLAEKAAK
ncbi:MAG: hypothetical protein QOI07_406 [Verrucomicrobiota bacterium]